MTLIIKLEFTLADSLFPDAEPVGVCILGRWPFRGTNVVLYSQISSIDYDNEKEQGVPALDYLLLPD